MWGFSVNYNFQKLYLPRAKKIEQIQKSQVEDARRLEDQFYQQV